MEKLNITSTVLDKLGFSEYWAGSGDFGKRTIRFEDGSWYDIIEYDEKEDANDGYTPIKKYVTNHYANSFNYRNIFFLHELYEVIRTHCSPTALDEFYVKCKEVNMSYYIDKYLDTIKEEE